MADSTAPHQAVDNDDSEWFERWFATEFYLKLYSHRDRAEAERCVSLVLGSLPPDLRESKPLRALDLACGAGRHAVTLAEHGVEVTAVDLSPTLLTYARETARQESADLRFIRKDMREIEFHREFELAVQLFTSFGYFESSDDDMLVLRKVRESLVDGGHYFLDLINRRFLAERLVPHSERELDGSRIIEEREIAGGRVRKSITVLVDGRADVYHESVRLYEPQQIESMLREASLIPVRWYGDYDGCEFDPERSPRMMVVAVAG